MAYCPRCGTWLNKAEKKLENQAFTIAVYNCVKCGLNFKTT